MVEYQCSPPWMANGIRKALPWPTGVDGNSWFVSFLSGNGWPALRRVQCFLGSRAERFVLRNGGELSLIIIPSSKLLTAKGPV